jgi:hypothetical protein
MKKSKDMEDAGKVGKKMGQEVGKLFSGTMRGKVNKCSIQEEINLGNKMAEEFKKNAKGEI